MARAFSYIRFSTPEQQRGGSLVRQLEKSEAWAEARGLELDSRMRDLGISGWSGANRKKGHLGRFLKLVEDRVVEPGSFLLLENCDRLSREEPLDAFDIFKRIVQADITIVTTDDGQEYNREIIAKNPMSLMFWIMSTIRGNTESARKSEMLRPAWERKRAAAREQKRAISGSCPRWLRKVGDRYETIPEREALVKRIFNELDGGLGVQKLTKKLNDEGVPPMGNGKGWHHTILLQLVRSGAVIGIYQPMTRVDRATGKPLGKRVPDGDPITDYYPPVIEADQFHRVNTLLTSRRFNAPGRKGVAYSNLLQGLSRCRHCGGPMLYRNKGKGNGAVSLKCANAIRQYQCTQSLKFPYKALEAALLNHIKDIDLSGPKSSNPAEAALATAEGQREETKRRIAALLTLVEDGDETAMERYRERRAELREIEQQIAALKAQVKQHRASLPASSHQDALKALNDQLATLTGEDLYAARARISEAFRAILDRVEFEVWEGRQIVSVYVLGGAKTHGFELEGETYRYRGGIDLTAFIESGVLDRAEYDQGDAYRQRELDRIIAASRAHRLANVFKFETSKSLTFWK